MNPLPEPTVCLVTDRRRCGGRPLERVVSLALDGGVNAVQLREKDLPASELLDMALMLRGLTAGRALLLVNDRVDVALAAGADGVQLGEEALPVEAVRQLFGDRLLIGRSVHSLEGAVAAEAEGADYLVAGSIFPSASHPGRAAAGVRFLEQLKPRVGVPYLAIGGVTPNNVEDAVRAGATGAAVITAISESGDPQRAAGELVAAATRALEASRAGAAGQRA